MVNLKTKTEIEKIKAAGAIVADVLLLMEEMISPGITTLALDNAAENFIRKAGGAPSFKGYGKPPFPASICCSLDHEVVHGIPLANRIIEEGMLVSIDVGVYLNGFHADAARTFAVGQTSQAKTQLMQRTEQCFWEAYAQAKPGNRLGDLSSAVQNHAEKFGYGVVRELTGHGIGEDLHEQPDLPNFGKAGYGLRLEPGLVLAMEPMINLGTRRVVMKEDGWTIVTADGKPSAHYENTFAITSEGAQLLTVKE